MGIAQAKTMILEVDEYGKYELRDTTILDNLKSVFSRPFAVVDEIPTYQAGDVISFWLTLDTDWYCTCSNTHATPYSYYTSDVCLQTTFKGKEGNPSVYSSDESCGATSEVVWRTNPAYYCPYNAFCEGNHYYWLERWQCHIQRFCVPTIEHGYINFEYKWWKIPENTPSGTYHVTWTIECGEHGNDYRGSCNPHDYPKSTAYDTTGVIVHTETYTFNVGTPTTTTTVLPSAPDPTKADLWSKINIMFYNLAMWISSLFS